MIRREINGAIIKLSFKYGHISDENTKEVISNLDNIENTVNELNRSFYEMLSELEGKFSIHDKEIEILTEKIDENSKYIKSNISKISSEISEGKKNITKISKSQQSNEKILRKTIVQSKVENKTNDISNTRINVDKKLNFSREINSANIDKDTIENKDINISTIASKSIFVESLNDIEKEKLRDNIIELRHRGFSVNQIAKKLGVGVGELQLVLNLHRK
ncbi:MAG: hypothetical protein WBA54_06115 [Acidaminobacteraceae bacterium]